MMGIYKDIPDTPKVFYNVLNKQRERLQKVQKEKGDYVSPFEFYREKLRKSKKRS